MKPLASIVIPVRNGEGVIERALTSLKNQALTDIEIIVIDDGSNDRTADILGKCIRYDKRIKFFRQSPLGIVTALNLGIKSAAAKYIIRMDADDQCCSQRIVQQVDYLDKHKDIAVLGGAIRRWDTSCTELGTVFFPTCHYDIFHKLRSPGDFWALAHPTVAFNKDLLGVDLEYKPHYKYAEDYELWLRLSRKYVIANTKEILCDIEVDYLSMRRTRPYIAYRSVLGAYCFDYVIRNSGLEIEKFLVREVRFKDVMIELRRNPELNYKFLEAVVLFAWRLQVSPNLISKLWNYITMGMQKISRDEIVLQLMRKNPRITELPDIVLPEFCDYLIDCVSIERRYRSDKYDTLSDHPLRGGITND